MYLPAGVKQLGEEHFPLVIGQSAAQQWAEEKQGQSWASAVQNVKDRFRAVQGRAGQGRVLTPRFRLAAARHFVAAPSLIYWLIVKKQGFCGIDAVACVSTWKLVPERSQWVEACSQPEGKATRHPAKDALMRRSWHNWKHFSTSVVRFIIAISRRPSRHQYYHAGLLDMVGLFSCCEYSRQRGSVARQRFAVGMGQFPSRHCFPVRVPFFPISSELPLH